MKGVDDFIYVLVIALVLIAIFTIVSVMWPYSGVPGTPGGPDIGENITVAELSIGEVGYAENQPKSSPLGTFTVGETQTNELKKVPQLEISAGWFGGNKETFKIEIPSYYTDSLRGIVIAFNVYDTNQYGNLNVRWNGKDFYNEKVPRGSYTVRVDSNYIDDVNELEISSDGPGLAFWAATVYTLRDFKVNLEYGPSKLIAFTLAQSDLDAFTKGELEFIGFGTSNLRVKINGYKIWDQVPDGVETIGFNYTDVPLRLGENILSLDCPTGQATLNNAELSVYVLTNQITRTRSFDMTENHYNLMDQQAYTGTLRFKVDSINRPGEISIELNGNALSLAGTGIVRQGWNTATFDASDAMSGSNTLEFSGNGYWDISEVQVLIGK